MFELIKQYVFGKIKDNCLLPSYKKLSKYTVDKNTIEQYVIAIFNKDKPNYQLSDYKLNNQQLSKTHNLYCKESINIWVFLRISQKLLVANIYGKKNPICVSDLQINMQVYMVVAFY